jgi:mxaD protein
MRDTTRLAAALACGLVLAAETVSAGDLSVKRTLSLAASPEATWSIIADYCALEKWHPAIAKCEIVKGSSNQLGAVRALTLRDGGARVTEELTAYDAKKRTYSYKILEAPLPITSYVATLAVVAGAGGGSVVEWSSTFQAGPGADDAAARSIIEGIYDAGLASLKAMAAGQ